MRGVIVRVQLYCLWFSVCQGHSSARTPPKPAPQAHQGLQGKAQRLFNYLHRKSLFCILFYFFICQYKVLLIYLFIFIFIQLQLSAFSPDPSTPPQPVPLPSPTSTLPLDFVLVSFIVAPIDPFPHYPLPTPLWLLIKCT